MPDFDQILKEYGANCSYIQETFGTNQSFYLRCLDMLFEDPNLTELGQAMEAEDWKQAFEAAHTLKGVSGNLGLTPLYEAVCVIVEPLRAGDAIAYDPFYQSIQNQFQKVHLLRKKLKGEE